MEYTAGAVHPARSPQLSDAEYIDQLLAEIATLKQAVKTKDALITQLCDTIKNIGSPKTTSSAPDSLEPSDVPARSARRRQSSQPDGHRLSVASRDRDVYDSDHSERRRVDKSLYVKSDKSDLRSEKSGKSEKSENERSEKSERSERSEKGEAKGETRAEATEAKSDPWNELNDHRNEYRNDRKSVKTGSKTDSKTDSKTESGDFKNEHRDEPNGPNGPNGPRTGLDPRNELRNDPKNELRTDLRSDPRTELRTTSSELDPSTHPSTHPSRADHLPEENGTRRSLRISSAASELTAHSNLSAGSVLSPDTGTPVEATHPTLKPSGSANSVSSYKSRIRLPYTLANKSNDDWRRSGGETGSTLELSRASSTTPVEEEVAEPPQSPQGSSALLTHKEVESEDEDEAYPLGQPPVANPYAMPTARSHPPPLSRDPSNPESTYSTYSDHSHDDAHDHPLETSKHPYSRHSAQSGEYSLAKGPVAPDEDGDVTPKQFPAAGPSLDPAPGSASTLSPLPHRDHHDDVGSRLGDDLGRRAEFGSPGHMTSPGRSIHGHTQRSDGSQRSENHAVMSPGSQRDYLQASPGAQRDYLQASPGRDYSQASPGRSVMSPGHSQPDHLQASPDSHVSPDHSHVSPDHSHTSPRPSRTSPRVMQKQRAQGSPRGPRPEYEPPAASRGPSSAHSPASTYSTDSAPVAAGPVPQVPATPDAFTGRRLSHRDSSGDNSAVTSPQGQGLSPPYRAERGPALTGQVAPQHVSAPQLPHRLDSPHLAVAGVTTPKTGSFQVLSSPQPDDDLASLFIKPDDFASVKLVVASTISVNDANVLTSPSSRKIDEVNFTLSVNDRASDKQMWRLRKSYLQLVSLDSDIRPFVDCFGLPPLPDKALFTSTSPLKIDQRRTQLQAYFNSWFAFPHVPQMTLVRLCRFLSLDFVNPLDDNRSGARKEGYLLRRYKGLGTSWRVRWCQVDGPHIEVYEYPSGPLMESVRLAGAQIGRQNSDSVADDKGYRHAFLVMEARPNTKVSSLPKHFFCAETDEERDAWVDVLLEYNDPASPDQPSDDHRVSSGSSHRESQSSYAASHRESQASHRESQASHRESQTSYRERDTSGSTIGTGAYGNYTSDASPATSVGTVATEEKKKKKSLFPFRYRSSNGTVDDIPAAQAPLSSSLSQSLQGLQQSLTGAPVAQQVAAPNASRDAVAQPHTPNQPNSMQRYIDQLTQEENNHIQAVFGRDLYDVYQLSHHRLGPHSVPSIVFRCIDYLTKTGAVYEEGIFRLSGSASSIRTLKDQFNRQFDVDLFESAVRPDIHTVAGLFKTYLRELPSPVLGSAAVAHLAEIATHHRQQPSEVALAFRAYVRDNLDPVRYDTAYVLFNFLQRVIGNASRNRMNLRNVCIVFVPTLNIGIEVLSAFLSDFSCIFEGVAPVPDAQREALDVSIPSF
ncbi:hypothetical protein DICA4_E14356 [Diutina catenulata]